MGSLIVQGFLHLLVGIMLARLLSPADFGLAALALIVIGFAAIVSDVGIAAAVIQRRVLSAAHLQVAFTLSMAAGVGIAATLLVLAPWFASLARDAAVAPVLRVQSLVFVATGAGSIARAQLQRRLDFQQIFRIDLASYLVGYALIAVGGAFLGWGVWSLVLGSIVQSAFASVLSLRVTRSSVRPLLRQPEVRELLAFGAGVTTNGVVAYVGRNGDNFLVGRFLGIAALGIYGRAFNFMMLPVNYICSVLPTVLTPAFSEIQTDIARVGRGYLLGVQAATLATAPIMVGIVVAAPHLIIGIYGEQWSGAVVPLQILAAAGIPRATLGLSGAVTQACNRVASETPLQVGFAVAVMIGTALGSRYGLAGVALFVSIAISLLFAAQARLALSITKGTWKAFGSAHLPGLLLAMVTLGATVPIRVYAERAGLSHVSILAMLVGASAASIPLGLYLMPARIRPRELFHQLSKPIARFPAMMRTPLLHVLGLVR